MSFPTAGAQACRACPDVRGVRVFQAYRANPNRGDLRRVCLAVGWDGLHQGDLRRACLRLVCQRLVCQRRACLYRAVGWDGRRPVVLYRGACPKSR